MEWLAIVVQLVQALAWPVTVGILILSFRGPIGAFLTSIKEVSGFGVSAKRGDKEAGQLLGRVVHDDSAPPSDGETSALLVAKEAATQQASPISTDSRSRPAPSDVERFSFGVAAGTLQHYDKECTSQIGSEGSRLIVVSAYATLLGYIRALEYAALPDSENRTLPRYSGDYSYTAAQSLGAPEGIVQDLVDMKDFEKRVVRRDLEISHDGARNFVAACLDILRRCHAWQTNDAVDERPILDRIAD